MALGATVSVKIWWIVPFALTVLWVGWRLRAPRQLCAVLAGAALITVVVDGPFFVAAPHAMWSSVIQDQVSRPDTGSRWLRLADLSSLPRLTGALSHPVTVAAGVLVLLLGAVLVLRAWGVVAARPAVVLLVVQAVVLLASPSWFPYYADFLAVAAAITCGAAVLPRRPVRRRPAAIGLPVGWVTLAAAAAITVPALVIGRDAVVPFRGAAALERATRSVQCVSSDSPTGQIELDALTRGLTHGCRNWVDVTGRTYGPDRSASRRIDNRRWQRDLTDYLRSGGAILIVRPHGSGIAPATWDAISSGGVLARAAGHVVYRAAPLGRTGGAAAQAG